MKLLPKKLHFALSTSLIVWAGIGAVRQDPPAPKPEAAPFRSSGIYRVGEKVGWKIAPVEGGVEYTLRQNGGMLLQEGKLDFSKGPATIEATLDEPAMLFLQLKAANGPAADFGAAVSPERIKPVVSTPDDFDAFWKRKVDELHAVPMNPVVTPGESSRQDVEYATIQMDHVNGTHVYGQLAKPKKPGKYPAMLILLWASPPYPVHPSWVEGPAGDGWLALNIEPHDVLPREPASYYQSLPEAIKNYAGIQQEDREKNYFVEMYLRGVRAVDYLASRPDWDGKTLLVMGTSMGGQQSLAVAGLHSKVTHMIVNVPAGCDLNGPLFGRSNSYPFFPPNNPKAMETARYIDAVNFAPHIKATSLVGLGFVDTACSPAGIWTAFNRIAGPKEIVPMMDSPHNHLATPAQQEPINRRTAEWLAALVKEGKVAPRPFKAP